MYEKGAESYNHKMHRPLTQCWRNTKERTENFMYPELCGSNESLYDIVLKGPLQSLRRKSFLFRKGCEGNNFAQKACKWACNSIEVNVQQHKSIMKSLTVC